MITNIKEKLKYCCADLNKKSKYWINWWKYFFIKSRKNEK